MSTHRAKEPFELIHIDTWGPYRVQTREGFRYFLTIVDDFSRVTWIHLLKAKNEAYGALVQFLHMARNQLGKHVKRLRSDNAAEFEDKLCKPLFEQLGIIHETTCADTPQQNGRAERRHRNILEMGRALRFQCGLPLQYWGECIQTAVHITNKLPSQVLNNLSPYEVLYNCKPDYSYFKVFGCLTVAVNPDRQSDKFKPRGVPCVFLGYPNHKKGYKLLNLLNNSLFISRNVKFYEHIFPYKIFKPHSSPSNTPLTLHTLDDFDDWCIVDQEPPYQP